MVGSILCRRCSRLRGGGGAHGQRRRGVSEQQQQSRRKTAGASAPWLPPPRAVAQPTVPPLAPSPPSSLAPPGHLAQCHQLGQRGPGQEALVQAPLGGVGQQIKLGQALGGGGRAVDAGGAAGGLHSVHHAVALLDILLHGCIEMGRGWRGEQAGQLTALIWEGRRAKFLRALRHRELLGAGDAGSQEE